MSNSNQQPQTPPAKPAQPNLFAVLKPYMNLVAPLILFAVASNLITLFLPKLISKAINNYVLHNLVTSHFVYEFAALSVAIFIFIFLQSIIQTYASERVGRDLREELAGKISRQSYTYIQTTNPAKLLTNLTSDIDSIKMFVSQGVVNLTASLFTIIGGSVFLMTINWKLALAVLAIIPIIGATFYFVLQRVRSMFIKSREIVDWLNKVINESILGAALIRVLHSQSYEYEKFIAANSNSRDLGYGIVKMFASMIPIITMVANLAVLTILAWGGHFIIAGTLTLGDFAAFNTYVALIIFPIFVIGFVSNIMAQATASYVRVREVLDAPVAESQGTIKAELRGRIEFKDVSLSYGEKPALKDVNFAVQPKSRNAIIGPTAAGKTQILHLMTGLIKPNQGEILFDGHKLEDYDSETLYRQIGFVFQDSIMFNMSIRENIAFNKTVTDADLQLAIETAELSDFVNNLPEKLDTIVSERGTSLSGGQKQRIMLARALALNPKILLLDDFTARVDSKTEQRILKNVHQNYPDLTLLSVTQKISSVMDFDQIIVLMEGEVLAKGRHEELIHSSPEYVQIYNSQLSTSQYEVHA
jgi:ATP-binding cassette subfamily B protein